MTQMLTAQKTLGINIGIYASIVVLIIFHGLFFGLWVKHVGTQIKAQKERLKTLQTDLAQEQQKTDLEKKRVQDANEEVERRAAELRSYGDFLPSQSQKTDIISKILALIETLGIKIRNQDFNKPLQPAAEGAGYLTFSFSLDLEGDYRAIKRFLYGVQTQPMVIRITNFRVTDYGATKPFRWKVNVEFQTYFGS